MAELTAEKFGGNGYHNWCIVEGSISVISEPANDKSHEVTDKEYMVAMKNDQEREDVSTTASGGNVNPSWL